MRGLQAGSKLTAEAAVKSPYRLESACPPAQIMSCLRNTGWKDRMSGELVAEENYNYFTLDFRLREREVFWVSGRFRASSKESKH